jgi:hypothetical protein
LTGERELALLLKVVSVIVICCMTSILARVRASVARLSSNPTRNEELGVRTKSVASRNVSLPYSHVSGTERGARATKFVSSSLRSEVLTLPINRTRSHCG